MKRISSGSLFISKKVFPLFWFGILGLIVIPAFTTGATAENPMVIVVPLAMGAFGFFIMKKLVFDLADEVYDCQDHLLVKIGREEEAIPLSNIMNVSVSTFVNPPRITLRLVNPGKFGEEVAFSPIKSFTLNPFAKNEIAEALIVRAYEARSRRAL